MEHLHEGYLRSAAKLKLALSIAAAALWLTPLAAAAGDDNDRNGDRHHGQHRPGAAALKDCCTPGDEDFPKVGGNLGNQNYSSCRRSIDTSCASSAPCG